MRVAIAIVFNEYFNYGPLLQAFTPSTLIHWSLTNGSRRDDGLRDRI